MGYIAVRDAAVSGMIWVQKEGGETNLVDLLEQALNTQRW